jgi:hypothetical protein
MSVTIPNTAEVIWLDAVTGKAAATAWTLRLATAITPALSKTTVVAEITEAACGGYAAVPLLAANWTSTAGSPSHTDYPLQSFIFTGALVGNPDIVAYYVTRADGALIAVEPIVPVFTPATNGDQLDITPVLTLGSITND